MLLASYFKLKSRYPDLKKKTTKHAPYKICPSLGTAESRAWLTRVRRGKISSIVYFSLNFLLFCILHDKYSLHEVMEHWQEILLFATLEIHDSDDRMWTDHNSWLLLTPPRTSCHPLSIKYNENFLNYMYFVLNSFKNNTATILSLQSEI